MTPLPNLTERLSVTARFGVSYILIALFFLLNITAFSLPYIGAIKAPLILMAVYYWSVFRPTLLPPWIVFAMGVLFDLISGFPVGIYALVLLVVRWLVSDGRRYLMGQPFVMMWVGFIVVSIGATFTEWLLFSAINMQWVSIHSAGVNMALGVALFPALIVVLHMSHKILPHNEHDFGS